MLAKTDAGPLHLHSMQRTSSRLKPVLHTLQTLRRTGFSREGVGSYAVDRMGIKDNWLTPTTKTEFAPIKKPSTWLGFFMGGCFYPLNTSSTLVSG